jgi:hypothetical protein
MRLRSIEEAGPMDGVYDEDDLGPVVKRRRLHDEDENMRTEDLEETWSWIKRGRDAKNG